MRYKQLFRIPILLAALCAILLMGCADGLSGSAIGQNASRTEALQQELAAMARDLADLNTYYSGLEFEVDETISLARSLMDLSEDMVSKASDYKPETVLALDESRQSLWRIENSLFDLIESRERTIGELLSLVTVDITYVLASYSNEEAEIEPASTERFDELFEVLANQEAESSGLLDQLFDIENNLTTMDLAPSTDTRASSPTGGANQGGSESNSEESLVFLWASSDEEYQEWITGEYYPCTSTPCGHLGVTTWNGKDIYVKVSGQNTDPDDDWYWAYIFQYAPGTWVIQYVSPALTDSAGNYLWNAHRYSDSTEPWNGTWDDITIHPFYQ